MTTADTLNQLWEDLAAPSATKFLKALRARGIAAREKDVREFVADKSERQILSKVTYTGKVVAASEDERWAADLINFTSRPAVRGGKTYTQVLFVQDLFTRFLYTKPMTTAADTRKAFEEILKVRQPRRLDTDRGTEFTAEPFQKLCDKYDIILVLKEKNDLNGLARMDNAIGELKKNIRKLQEIQGTGGGNWLQYLEKATKAFNQTANGALHDATPADIPANVRLELSNQAAVGAEHNMNDILRRKETLQRLGAFRVLTDKSTGLKRRVDANTWGSKIHIVASFPREAEVIDEEGNQFKTKRVLAVPLTSTATAPPEKSMTQRLREYAVKLQAVVKDNPTTIGNAIKALARATGIRTILKEAGISARQLIANHPDLFDKQGRNIIARVPPSTRFRRLRPITDPLYNAVSGAEP